MAFSNFPNITAEVFLVLYAKACFLLSTTFPQYLLYQSCYQKYNSTICNQLDLHATEQQISQKDASFWLSMTYLARYLPSSFTMIMWGCFADRIGKHRAMIIPPTIMGLQCLLYVICSCYPDSSQLYIVAISSLAMFYGDLSGVFVIVNSYIAAISNKENGSRRLMFVHGITILTDVVTALMSGYLLEAIGFTYTFVVPFVICAINLCFVLCCAKPLPIKHIATENSYLLQPREKKEGTKVMWNNPLKDFSTAYKVIRDNKYRLNFLIIMTATILNWFGSRGKKMIIVLYITNAPLDFLPSNVGYYLAYYSFIQGAGTIIFGQVLTKYCRLNDYVIIIIGLIAVSLVFFFIGLSKNELFLYLASSPGIASSISIPVLRSLVTKLVGSQDTAKLLSVLESIGVICSLVAGLFVTNIYSATLHINTGIVFFVLSSVAMSSLLIVIIFICLLKKGILADPTAQIVGINDTSESCKQQG